ncbi:MAG TPA: CsgG/HfaB family protein [Thermodesulfobacteriota bacterium]|nr:CsgG/HfaB family protein [Thermodesulfobacteriota bacterium]
MRKRNLALLIVFAMVIYGCATPGGESFKLGKELAKNNRLEEAIAMYEDAVAKEPKNAEYQDTLKKAKDALSAKHQEKAKSILAKRPLTYDQARLSYQEAEAALRLTPESSDAASLVKQVQSEMDRIGKMAETKYAEAMKAIEKNEWAEGVKKLREVNAIYPRYLDSAAKLKQAESEGVSYYLQEAEKFKKEDDWEKVMKPLLSAREISPDRAEVNQGLQEARLKHNPDYYLQKAEECGTRKDWDMAVVFAGKAANLGLSAEGNKRVALIRQQASKSWVAQCGQKLNEKKLYTAYQDALKALSYDPSIKSEPGSAEVINQLLAAMAAKAGAYDTQGYLGNAFAWYEKLAKIDPNNQEVFFKTQAVRDKIRGRVIRKIAIMDFTPPSGHPDAGRIITDSLLSYITAHAGSDVKILARDVLGAILKEIELGQAGLYDIESAKKAGKLQGTDVFIFGSVLNYNVEKNVSEGFKADNIVVGKRTVPNRAYELWLMMVRGKPSKEELMNAPPATIEEEIRETVKYKVGTEKKRATVGVSFRVIDLEQGEVVITKTIRKSHEAMGDYSEGVAFANIKYKALEIPADSEILEKVTQDVITELSYEVVSRFQNLQTLYFNAAEGLKKKREYEKAVEKYMDAMHLEELKNISSPLSENARTEVEQLLQRIAL